MDSAISLCDQIGHYQKYFTLYVRLTSDLDVQQTALDRFVEQTLLLLAALGVT